MTSLAKYVIQGPQWCYLEMSARNLSFSRSEAGQHHGVAGHRGVEETSSGRGSSYMTMDLQYITGGRD